MLDGHRSRVSTAPPYFTLDGAEEAATIEIAQGALWADEHREVMLDDED